MKILHSADWHLDAPLQGRTAQQAQFLKTALRTIPAKIAALCKQEGCDAVVLSGDLLDGAYTKESYLALRNALAECEVPVLIAPGNHDFYAPSSPWAAETWPDNVHIFTENHLEFVEFEGLPCRFVGAAFTCMDCPSLLEGFTAPAGDTPVIGVLHGDPTQADSPYCRITSAQVQQSGLSYLALGHIHKKDAFRAGNTLCAWPGCPMGKGYDEQGDKGVYIVSIENGYAQHRFVSLGLPKFFDLEIPCTYDPAIALANALPAVANGDFYRITFTGAYPAPDLASLQLLFSGFPNLQLRDNTTAPVDLWASVGSDTLEGMYFLALKNALENAASNEEKEKILLAAEISRRILDGQEVTLP
jgi:predicted phosphodiesterase